MPVPATKRVRKEVPDQFAKLRQITYAWHTPAMFYEGDAEFDIVANVLASRTGRLERILVHEQQVAQNVRARQASQQHGSYFSLAVTLKSDADLAAVESVIEQELTRLVSEPISQREFDRAVTGIESSFVWGLENLFRRADTLQRYNHYYGDPGALTRDLDRYRVSSPAKVQTFVAKYLRTDAPRRGSYHARRGRCIEVTP